MSRGAAHSLYLEGDLRAELSVLYHQLMGELVALAVLPHSFVIFSVSAARLGK